MTAIPLKAVPRAAILRGAVAALPLQLATAPFGLIFGAIAAKAGLDLIETLGMTLIIVAGAAQLASLQQMTDHAPALLAILTGAVVNARMAMYSASIAPYWQGASFATRAAAAFLLHDQAYALALRRYVDTPAETTEARIGFFLGVGLLSVAVWTAGSVVGALIGARLPEAWALEFAVPIAFIAVLAPLLRTAPHMAAAGTAALGALAFAPLPLGLGILPAALAGIAAGVTLERWLERRAALS